MKQGKQGQTRMHTHRQNKGQGDGMRNISINKIRTNRDSVRY